MTFLLYCHVFWEGARGAITIGRPKRTIPSVPPFHCRWSLQQFMRLSKPLEEQHWTGLSKPWKNCEEYTVCCINVDRCGNVTGVLGGACAVAYNRNALNVCVHTLTAKCALFLAFIHISRQSLWKQQTKTQNVIPWKATNWCRAQVVDQIMLRVVTNVEAAYHGGWHA